jgi:hypothetical protein
MPDTWCSKPTLIICNIYCFFIATAVRRTRLNVMFIRTYEMVSKIFRTGAVICTAVVVARSTGTNRPKCEFRVLLRRFAATAWKRAKTSPRNLARTDLAASPWQRPVLHFRPHPDVSGEIQNGWVLHPPYSPGLTACDFLFPKIKLKLNGRRFDTIWADPGWIAECLTLWQKRTSRKRSKNW